MENILDGSGRNVCLGSIPAVKKPLFRTISLPVSSEYLKIDLRKQGISIFAAFRIANEQLHFIAMDIHNFKGNHFTYAKSSAIECHQNALISQVVADVKKGLDFLLGKNLWEFELSAMARNLPNV